MNLKTDFVPGLVKMGVVENILVKGVGLLIGNDFAWGKCLADPVVCYESSTLERLTILKNKFQVLFLRVLLLLLRVSKFF